MQEVRADLTCAGGQGGFNVCRKLGQISGVQEVREILRVRRPYRVYPGWQRLTTSTTAAEVDDEHGEQDAEAGEDHGAQVE